MIYNLWIYEDKMASSIINDILLAVDTNDAETIYSSIESLPIGISKTNVADKLLSLFISRCMSYKNTKLTRFFIDYFDIARANIDPIPTITGIFLNEFLDKEGLKYITSCFPEKEPIDYFIDIINIRNDNDALKIATKLVSMFHLSYENWENLVVLTKDDEDEDYHNTLLREFILSKFEESKVNASKPLWMKQLPKRDLPIIDVKQVPCVKIAVDQLLINMKKEKIQFTSDDTNIDVENSMKELLISQYAISTMKEKQQLLNIKNTVDDILLFQEFGPVNSLYSHHTDFLNQTHDCVKYGGCRMLICREFEEMYVDGDMVDLLSVDSCYPVADWFRGSCDECLKKITSRYCCVRQPLINGGWRGCYCSFECLLPHVEDANTSVMVGRMKEQLETIGIRDR